MSNLEWKSGTSSGVWGEFESRMWRTDSEPDSQGDVIARGSVKDGHGVLVSFSGHDLLLGSAEAVGTAKLYQIESAVHAVGQIRDTNDGRRFKQNLQRLGPDCEWSPGFLKSSVKSRAPTSAELARWPDARRYIESWQVLEISPVARGACGPSCRTLGVKCAGGCGCDGRKQMPERPEYLERHQWVGTYEQRRVIRRAWSAAMKATGLASEPTLRWFRFTPEAGCAGEYLPPPYHEVWVARDFSEEETLKVFLHEMRHAAQWQDGDPVAKMGLSDPWLEGQCNGFASYHARELIRDGILV